MAGRAGERPAPLSTYRVQLRPGWGFDQVAGLADYLAALGVSHVYCSPYLQAAPGSTHGYDVVDPTRPNAELGGAGGHRRMGEALAEAGLGQVLDLVPNHMAITGPENAWWWDVLENCPSSVYASYFDVDWDPPEVKLRNLVLMPILGDHYGRVLDAGQLTLERTESSFLVRYADHVVPVAPRSLEAPLAAASRAVRGPEDPDPVADELESIAAALGNLPPSWATDRESVRARHRDKEVLRGRLADLCRDEPAVAGAVDAEVAAVNADPEALDALLERQNYRLAYWRAAGQELDYRRFF
ncbi:MAG: alpha-amylase family glycosyl hydrolase, partial [Acidimicrobiales bacterium]